MGTTGRLGYSECAAHDRPTKRRTKRVLSRRTCEKFPAMYDGDATLEATKIEDRESRSGKLMRFPSSTAVTSDPLSPASRHASKQYRRRLSPLVRAPKRPSQKRGLRNKESTSHPNHLPRGSYPSHHIPLRPLPTPRELSRKTYRANSQQESCQEVQSHGEPTCPREKGDLAR